MSMTCPTAPVAVVPVAVLRLAAMLALLAMAACARDAGDWKSAQQADTQAAYEAFLAKHPDSEFAAQARARGVQLAEERDWGVATQADTPEAYDKFVAQHPDGKWTQEARIRIENFNVMAAAAPEASAEPVVPAVAPDAGAASKPAVATAAAPAGRSSLAKNASEASGGGAKPPASAPVPAPASTPAPAVAAAPTASRSASPAAQAQAGATRVQLGAFSSVDKAEAEWTRARARFAPLQSLEPRITPAETRAGRLFRLQAALPDAAAAKALCEQLKAAGQACLVVPAK